MSLKPALLAAVLLTACTGEIVGPRADPATVGGGGPTVTDRPEWFACTPGADPSSEVVLRLTPTQYRNSLEDLLGRAFTPTQLAPLWTANAARLDAIPVDGSTHRGELTYDSMDQRISPLLVTPQFELSTAIGEWIANDTTRLATFTRFFGGAVCTTPTAPGCVDAVIDGLGARALRRPLDADDRTTYRGAFDDTTYGGYRALIAAFLMSPDFLFRTEFRGEAVASRSDLTALTAYEIANRLSFALTNSMPDEALLAAAAVQFTGDGQSVESQAARLLQTPRARTQYEHFYRQWLRLDRVPGINPSAVSALELNYPDGSAPSLPANTDLEQLRLDAFDEMVELMTWYSERGSLHDAIVSDVSFAKSPTLAKLYGVPVWNGAEDALVHFPAGQRAGLFTRAGYLLSGYPDTNPVMRGARLRVEYLCDVMEPPANTTPPANYMPPSVPTVRNVVTAKTEIAGSACQGCHQRSINPLGFPFESYDAFGRYRTQEPLHDMTGAVTSWVPVEASTQPDLDRNGDLHRAADGVSLSALLADSQRLHACFARHTFRYVLGRKELTAQDGCVLAGMERAAGTGTIQDLMKSLTRSTDFTLRRMPAGN